MHRATICIYYELVSVAGLLLPSSIAVEVAVTEQWDSAAAGTAFVHGRDQACKTFCSVSGHIS